MVHTRAPENFRVLIVDAEQGLAEDYRFALSLERERSGDVLLAQLDEDIFGPAGLNNRFPELDLVIVQRGQEALEIIESARTEREPFALAFIDVTGAPRSDGLRTASQIRTLDQDIQIVLVAATSDLDPVEMVERVPPANKLFYLQKPFTATELQQQILALTAKWQIDRDLAYQGEAYDQLASRHQTSVMAAVEQLPSGILLFDPSGQLTYANDQMSRLFPELVDCFSAGTKYENIQWEIANNLLPEEKLHNPEAWVRERLEWHASQGGILEQKLRGSRWILMIEGGAKGSETCCQFYDVTELKQREIRRAAAERMYQIAHAFGGLVGHLDSIAREGAEVRELTGLRTGTDGGSTTYGPQSGMPSDLVAKLRAIGQRQEMAPEVLSLSDVVHEIVEREKNGLLELLQVEIVAGAGLWNVLIDKTKLSNSVLELIKNAAEAMPSGGKLSLETANTRLSRDFVKARAGAKPGDYVRLTVKDTGVGISSDVIDRVLDPFYTLNGEDGHLGLGLSAAYGFVAQSGGFLDIEANAIRGLSVNLYFPRAKGGEDSVS